MLEIIMSDKYLMSHEQFIDKYNLKLKDLMKRLATQVNQLSPNNDQGVDLEDVKVLQEEYEALCKDFNGDLEKREEIGEVIPSVYIAIIMALSIVGAIFVFIYNLYREHQKMQEVEALQENIEGVQGVLDQLNVLYEANAPKVKPTTFSRLANLISGRSSPRKQVLQENIDKLNDSTREMGDASLSPVIQKINNNEISEALTMLQGNLEKLGALDNKAAELANAARDYSKMTTQLLKETKKQSFGFF